MLSMQPSEGKKFKNTSARILSGLDPQNTARQFHAPSSDALHQEGCRRSRINLSLPR
jgi:hypothetical protein